MCVVCALVHVRVCMHVGVFLVHLCMYQFSWSPLSVHVNVCVCVCMRACDTVCSGMCVCASTCLCLSAPPSLFSM